MGIGVIAFVAIIIVAFIIVFILKNSEGGELKENSGESDYTVKPYFFSIAEKEFYVNLKKVISTNYGDKYEIFPKVRLADIFNTQYGKKGIRRLYESCRFSHSG